MLAARNDAWIGEKGAGKVNVGYSFASHRKASDRAMANFKIERLSLGFRISVVIGINDT